MLLLLMVVACKRDVNLEFRMNGDSGIPDFKSMLSVDNLSKAEDSLLYNRLRDSVLTADLMDSLHVEVPYYEGSDQGIKSREWIINGEDFTSHLSGFKTKLIKPGFHSIQMCVNGKREDCITKYVYVKDSSLEIGPSPPILKITYPLGNPEKVNSRSIKLEGVVSNISSADQLKILLNNAITQTIELFDTSSGHFIAKIQRLQTGKNTISIVAYNGTDTVSSDVIVDFVQGSTDIKPGPLKPEKKPIPTELIKTSVAGWDSSGYKNNCEAFGPTEFTVIISPMQEFELQSFIVYSNECGGLKLTLSGDGKSQSVIRAVVKGESKLSLGDAGFRMAMGKTYTLTGQTISDYGGCKGLSIPKLLTASKCSNLRKHKGSPWLTIDQGTAEVIFEIGYRY